MSPPSARQCADDSASAADDDNSDGGNGFRIGYMSDVEGNWDYFLDSVRRSRVLEWEDAGRAPTTVGGVDVAFRRLTLVGPSSRFVYGGDAVDKGPGDVRLVRALTGLKRRHPDRVHLLVGNRDLNKLRLTSELSESDMARPIDDVPRPFWNPGATSLREHLEDVVGRAGRSVEEVNTRAERLRYMLKHTMGCPDTFEHRREEIGILARVFGKYPPDPEMHDVTPLHADLGRGGAGSIEVSDEEVVDSFLYEIGHPEGSLRRYLRLSSIAAIEGNTIFVHGAIDAMTMKYIPSLDTKFRLPKTSPPPFDAQYEPMPAEGRMVEDVHEWVRSLNEYLQSGLRDFEERPEWDSERASRGGEAVLAIQCRPAMWGRSVVCNSYADGGVIATPAAMRERSEALRAAREGPDPTAFEGIASDAMNPVPARWLLDHGIQRLVVGHKPTGDCPAALSSTYTGLEILAVDTSFSNRRDLKDGDGNKFGQARGDAIAMVEIAGEGPSRNRLEIFGALACGTEYSNRFPVLGGSHEGDDDGRGDPNLGRRLSDGWWVKVATPPDYRLCRGSGRLIEYDVRTMRDVAEELEGQPVLG